ncbi:MAG: hypothetical protein MPW14_20130 [Candidatus Manganitrophus sp.]|nr:MAG: hypothetical protein MPW14_20130 [Candidatus Manganitrophus sp.]
MAFLLVISFRAPRWDGRAADTAHKRPTTLRFSFWTAVLGLLWNIGSFAILALTQLGFGAFTSYVASAAFAALGLLPAVVIHSVLTPEAGSMRRRRAGIWIALGYLLGAAGGGMHFAEAILHGASPYLNGLYLLTLGFLLLLASLLLPMLKQPKGRIDVCMVGLSIASVGVFPMSFHDSGSLPWGAELISHYAALPLVLVILYKDHRFAFADLFLKRALALIFLVVIIMALAVFAAAPLFPGEKIDPWAALLVMSLWGATALIYPSLQRAVAYLVDSWILRRPDYQKAKQTLAARMNTLTAPDQILDEVCVELKKMLGVSHIHWISIDPTSSEEKRVLPAQPVVFRGDQEMLPGFEKSFVPRTLPRPDPPSSSRFRLRKRPATSCSFKSFPESAVFYPKISSCSNRSPYWSPCGSKRSEYARAVQTGASRAGDIEAGERSRASRVSLSDESAFSLQRAQHRRLLD